MKSIITGGAGFIGCNTAARLIREGHDVVVFDNLSRKGADKNLDWLKTLGDVEFVKGDIRNSDQLNALFETHSDVDFIAHLAAQVAVTTSVEDPRSDFEINLLGSFNLLESVRKANCNPFIVFASTNKVYGKLDSIPVKELEGRYEFDGVKGVSEQQVLDFYSPYGCSKGGADQYFLDYSRIYGITSCVFRMSCIYGPRQFGVEDQGWVAWFIIAAVLDRPITLYGDGKQVRDVLFVQDLVDLYLSAYAQPEISKGRVFNAGGGPENTLSLLELLDHIENRLEKKIPYSIDQWRPGDQKVYVSQISLAEKELSWTPKTDRFHGVDQLIDWVKKNKHLFE